MFYSLVSSAEVKNAWSYTSIPTKVFIAWRLVKHRVKFTFALLFSVQGVYIRRLPEPKREPLSQRLRTP